MDDKLLINPKKKEIAEFVRKDELDAAEVRIVGMIGNLGTQHKELCDEIVSFVERYNENVKRTNEALGFLIDRMQAIEAENLGLDIGTVGNA